VKAHPDQGANVAKRSLRGLFASIRERYRNGSKEGGKPDATTPAYLAAIAKKTVRLCWTRWRLERMFTLSGRRFRGLSRCWYRYFSA